jgi:molybdopterin-biosynthesis enzyme MoeA-like protein
LAGVSTAVPSLGLLVIGDELLSGKRSDKHLPEVIGLLATRGISLSWAQFLGDDEAQIAQALVQARLRGDVVLSCGGIGATPDDCTRQAAASAFGLPLEPHPEAVALIEAEYGERARPNRVLMAEFPRGAGLIPNPVNRVAGFSIGDCYFVPGFPEMAWPMLQWVLDHPLRALHRADPPVEYSLRALGSSGEGDLLGLMEDTLRRYPAVKLSSLPNRGDGSRPRHIEFGIKGPAAEAAAAFGWFRQQLALRPELQIHDLQGL